MAPPDNSRRDASHVATETPFAPAHEPAAEPDLNPAAGTGMLPAQHGACRAENRRGLEDMDQLSRRDVLVASAAGAILTRALPAAAQTAAPPPEVQLSSIQALIEAARAGSPDLGALMARQLPGLHRGGVGAVILSGAAPVPGTTTVPTRASGNVAAVWGQDFLFGVNSERPVTVSIDDA